jgi:hypothetical protein
MAVEISGGISASQLDQYSSRTGDAVTISTMKKALDIQASTAAQLIESIPAPTSGLPSNLGQNINVKV